jgi:phenylacetic acid degradation protein paaN
MNLFEKHSELISNSVNAIYKRGYYSPYPENPKSYSEELAIKSKGYLASIMNSNYEELSQTKSRTWVGEEVSPYLQTGIGIKYPQSQIEDILLFSGAAMRDWQKVSIEERVALLVECLEQVKLRFFDIAYATMHTTGQPFMMSFQASGPHSNDRALEAAIVGYQELTKYVKETDWIKPMGKFDIKIHKNWKSIPKGIGLAIGCSTFPVWNTVPAIFANLITGNSCIVKPHPKAILPIAIFIAEMQKVFVANSIDPNIVYLAVDTIDAPITKLLAEHHDIKLIDYTGSSSFGSYIESLNKTVFTEKAGVNSVIIDSVNDLKSVMQNIAFSVSLYSGQMCTAPQNVFISNSGIGSSDGIISYEDCVAQLCQSIKDLTLNPKSGPSIIGAIQNDLTLKRIKEFESRGMKVLLDSSTILNEEFPDARILTPLVIELDESNYNTYNEEYFGPVLFIIKTKGFASSLALSKQLAIDKGALTCAGYCIDDERKKLIEEEMNSVCVPVSFNFVGAAFINSHAAFSDLHLTGGNAAGNASLSNSEFLSRRFVWVGNRYC